MEPYTSTAIMTGGDAARHIAYEQAKTKLICEQIAEAGARAWMWRSIGMFALALVAETVVNLFGG